MRIAGVTIVFQTWGQGEIMRVWGPIASSLAITMACAAGAASAHEPDHRLPPITIAMLSEKAPRLETPASTTRLLSLRDRYTLADMRTRGKHFALGDLALAFSGSRLRSAGLKDPSGLRASERVSVFSAGMDAALDIVDGMRLRAFSTTMRVKRRLDLLPGASRSLNSSMMAAGVGIEQNALGSIVLDYTDNKARGRRDGLSRMTEQVGAAVPFGKGLRLSMTNATASDERGRLTWTVSAASIDRPVYQAGFGTSAGTLGDRRAEVAFRIAL